MHVGEDASPVTSARLLVRPERVRIKPGPIGVANAYRGTVERVVFLGAVADVHVRLDAGDLVVTAQLHGPDPLLQPGARVQVGWDAVDAIVVPRDET
jgi:ABC-type Fe3+/spermidine/putrescine transport system ATPase subunit